MSHNRGGRGAHGRRLCLGIARKDAAVTPELAGDSGCHPGRAGWQKGRPSSRPPNPKTFPEPPRQEQGGCNFPLHPPTTAKSPRIPARAPGSFRQGGRRSLKLRATPSLRETQSRPTRSPLRDLQCKFPSRLPSLLCSPRRDAGGKATLAHRFGTGAGSCRLLGRTVLGHPTSRLCPAGQGRRHARDQVPPAAMPSGQPSSHAGKRGLTCAMASSPPCQTQVFHRTRKFRGFPNSSELPALTDNAGMRHEENNHGFTQVTARMCRQAVSKVGFGVLLPREPRLWQQKAPTLALKRHLGPAAGARRVHRVHAWVQAPASPQSWAINQSGSPYKTEVAGRRSLPGSAGWE